MFYSQFILAKKGPLGTIWIAAHLERKLRKNQVADTDIGISVDSILSPDVPIALRLSSHLLLGVVRIYSRKVNYLFHDCSEALLKIKQAFRSTAVDLPPEESTAPYHSITLPETFDLDDFELPDSAFLQGNFDDHHVSTREQITLQDSVDGTGFSTSQFGLDERFGDGDGSQIRFELDEDLFLDKNPLAQHASALSGTDEGAVQQSDPSIPLADMDIDEGQNRHDVDKVPETSKDLSELLSNDCDKFVLVDNLKRNNASSHRHGYNIQTPDLNEVFFPNEHTDGPSAVPNDVAFADDDPPSPDLFECAQAPSTPGLMEEAIPANVQQIPALSPQGKTSDAVEVINKDTSIGLEFGGPDATNNDPIIVASMGPDATNNDPIIVASMGPELVDNGQVLSSPTSDLMEQKLVSLEPDNSVGVLATTDNLGGILAAPDELHLGCGQKNEDNLQSGHINNEINNLLIVHDSIKAIHPEVTCLEGLSSNLETPLSKPAADNVHKASNLEMPLNKPTTDDVHPEVTCIGSLLTASCSHEASNLEMPLNKSTVYNAHPEVTHVGGLLTSSCSHEASDLPTPLDKPIADDVVVMTSNDDVLMPGMTLDINSTSLGNKADPSIFVNQDYVKQVESCFTSNTLECNSELYLRSCSSQLNHANVLSSQVATLVGNAPEFSHRELTCNSEAPLREAALYVSGSSIGLQGEDHYTGSVTDNVQEAHQKADLVLSEFKSGVTKPDDQLCGLISKTIQLDNLHCCSSSDYPEPEKMLFASTGYANLQHDFGQFTADKGVTESAGSVDRISSLSGKKRRLMDSTPVLQIGSSAKISGLPRVRKNNAYLPEDDDILASILVGRAQNLSVGPTPPPPRTTRKRPRLTHKSGMPKRKVLLDDTMVLHADAIRQQLMNTEDIRRMRKKAPCTRPEIWTIHKNSMEEELFSESLFIGISTELGSLHTQRYDVNENLGPQIGKHHSDEQYFYAELSKEMEHSRSVELVRESSGKEIGELIAVMPDKDVGGMQEPSGTSVSVEVRSYVDAREKLEFHPPQSEPSGSNQSVTVSTLGINVHESVGTEMPLLSASHSGNDHEISTGFRIKETFIHINNNTHTSPEKSGAINIHQEQESPNVLVQPSGKLMGMGDKTFNFTGNASVDNITSAEEATRCGIVDSKVFAAVNDDTLVQDEDTSTAKGTHIFEVGNVVDVADLNCSIVDSKVFAAVNDDTLVRNEDTGIAKGTHILEEGNIVDVAALNCTQDYRDVGRIENGEILVSMLDRCLLEDREGLPADSSTVIGHVNSPTVDMAVKCAEPTELAMTSNAAMDRCLLEDREGLPADSSTVMGRANSPTVDMVVKSSEPTELAMTSNTAMDRCLLEDREGLPADSSTVIGNANSPTVDMAVESAEPTELAMTSNAAVEESTEDRSEVAPEGGDLVARVSADEERPTSEILCSETPQVISSCAHELNNGTENVPSAVGENSGLQECNLQCGFDAESVPMDLAAARESSDFCSAIDGNDTEFLSVDDEADFDEEADNDLPNPEEAQSPENSGWSTRTRGVARYLKTLFDEEYGRGKKVVAVEHLLAGKTRKEASRMFFETLVLKTRDYIHVEQENPFDCINIMPRPKLLKVGIPPMR